MLREEQIDIRRQRAKAGKFAIENLGKNRVFSDYRITNPESGGQYTVSFDLTGFAKLNVEGVDLNAGSTATINGKLEVATLQESVTVTAGADVGVVAVIVHAPQSNGAGVCQ